ncbi:MAG: zinc-ribbon domain-containing protein [Longimicrobiaceae bacterium]
MPQRYCSRCGAGLAPGASFCSQCGGALNGAGEGSRRPSWLPWAVAGAAALALAVVLTLSFLGRGGETGSETTFTPSGDAGSVDLSRMSAEEAAERLFNRVMDHATSSDTAEVRAFLPMAIAAHQRVPAAERDAYLRYHHAVLLQLAGDPGTALAQADTILAAHPYHLFGLFVAGESAEMMGDYAGARASYRAFLDAYPDQIASVRPEYQRHRSGLERMREHARQAVEG